MLHVEGDLGENFGEHHEAKGFYTYGLKNVIAQNPPFNSVHRYSFYQLLGQIPTYFTF
jgi:hypothetical protein